MQSSSERIEQQFYRRIQALDFPKPHSSTTLAKVGMSAELAFALFDSQVKSRILDIQARLLKEKGLGFYTIGSSGHEGNAVLGHVFRHTDMAFLHYRSGAFYIERAKKHAKVDVIENILLSLMTKSSDPISAGRHKVFGSVPLCIPPQTSTIASHLPKAVGMAFSLHRAKELQIESSIPYDSVILCSFGDASVNHASAQTSFNMASYLAFQGYPLPILFICEDNGLGISVPTPRDWIRHSFNHRQDLHYIACDGLNIADVNEKACQAEYLTRIEKKPVFLHIKTVRLMGHAGADIETTYCSLQEIMDSEADDPLLHTARILIEQTSLKADDLITHYAKVETEVTEKIELLKNRPCLETKQHVMESIVPKYHRPPKESLNDSIRQKIFADAYPQLQQKRTMASLINLALTDLLIHYPEMVIMGEDVGKKGGVYNVTSELQQRFGKRRVFDSPLDETSILGTAIGMAHNGFIPVPEIQFLAYVHNAEDQIRGEAATLSFFSNGQFQNPMLVRVPGLAYQKGFGGHFHNDNSIAIFRDIPGLVVACPSNGEDAVKMLRTLMAMAYQEGRISIFLEPIALYSTKDLLLPGDGLWMRYYPALEKNLVFGEVSGYGEGDVHVVSYGNGIYLARQAQAELQKQFNISIKVIDLHWLVPLPMTSLIKALSGAKSILIIDEGRCSGSVSEGLMAQLPRQCPIQRITGQDSFIPLGAAMQLMLPSKQDITNAILALVNS